MWLKTRSSCWNTISGQSRKRPTGLLRFRSVNCVKRRRIIIQFMCRFTEMYFLCHSQIPRGDSTNSIDWQALYHRVEIWIGELCDARHAKPACDRETVRVIRYLTTRVTETSIKAGTSNYIPQYLWDVITCPCPWFLVLAQKSPLETHVVSRRQHESKFSLLQVMAEQVPRHYVT